MTEKEATNKKTARFDDIFRMLLLVITVMISIGSPSLSRISLWSSVGYILLSLGLWMFAHAIGVKTLFIGNETMIKLYAWFLTSLVASVVFLKLGLSVATLEYYWMGICFLISLGVTCLAYWWLREILDEYEKRRFKKNFLLLLTIVVSGVFYLKVLQ